MASGELSRRIVNPNRQKDYLFDSTNTVSSKADHVKAVMRGKDYTEIVHPKFENMFSSLKHFPNAEIEMRSMNYSTDIGQDRRVSHQQDSVNGAHRFKFFKRPIIPYVPSLGGHIVYARPSKRSALVRESDPASLPTPPKSVGVQTIFRDSEAQTDPYSPEYTLNPTLSPPEILSLATLTFGSGLPANRSEIEMIQRARIKRAWEAALPKVVDEASFEVRLKMMEQMELKEWQEREMEIQRLQNARMDILEQVLEDRQADNHELIISRTNRIWQRKLQERDLLLEKIQKKRVKANRKLADKRMHVERKVERRDIISDYANYGSKVYAPKAREGIFIDKASETINISLGEAINNMGLQNSELVMPDSAFQPNVSIPSEKTDRSLKVLKEKHLQEQLKLMEQKLKDRKLNETEPEKPLRFAKKIEKPPERPITPFIEPISEEQDQFEKSALLLQKIIRGRAAQTLLFEGKERRLDLINELRTRVSIHKASIEAHHEQQKIVEKGMTRDRSVYATDGLSITSQTVIKDTLATNSKPIVREIQMDLSSSADRNLRIIPSEHEIKIEDNEKNNFVVGKEEIGVALFQQHVQAEYIGQTLDFLTKELTRLREDRRIAAMVKLAERIRRMREAEESGLRQAELKRQKFEDQVFTQVVSIHQETVDSYLEDVIMESVDASSSLAAREYVRDFAKKVDVFVDNLQKNNETQDDNALIVTDLVHAFLIPEVDREIVRENVKIEQRQLIIAAHDAVFSELPYIEKSVNKINVSPPRTRPASPRAKPTSDIK